MAMFYVTSVSFPTNVSYSSAARRVCCLKRGMDGDRVFDTAAEARAPNYMGDETRNLRLVTTRRDQPDATKLVEWILDIAEARHRAWVNGQPDPYGLPLPDDLPSTATARALSVQRERMPVCNASARRPR